MDGPVLLCGLGTVGWCVLDFLRTAGVSVIAIDQQADPADPRLNGVRFVKGDFKSKALLIEAGIHEVRGVLIVTSDDLVNLSTALMVRSVNADVRIVLRMFNQNLVKRLGKAVRNVAALSVSALAAPLLALTALTGDVLAAFPLGEGQRQIADIQIPDGSRLIDRRIGEISDNGRFLILAHRQSGHSTQMLQDIDQDSRLQSGDRFIVCGEPEDVQRLPDPSKDPFEVLWAGKLRRYGRLIWRTFAELDLAVKICTLTLLSVILFSTSVYHYGMQHSWPNSLYQTISVIATGADMGGNQYEGWGKVFVSFLRLTGAALIAAFTALLTNALLTARLGGAFEVRRIPDKGHVVVCGLGNVGYRVVEELCRLKERVVVVEKKTDNAFIASCRRQGVAVVIGDSTLVEVLRQARVDSARAVIVATSADLINLEIALLVAEIKSDQRVVVRIGDGTLAETVRKAANVKLALSAADLAAPAFVARMLGDRVQSIFLAGGRLLAVLEMKVTADDKRLTDYSLRVLAIDYHFIPVAVVGEDSKIRPQEMNYRLQPGDRLTVIAPLNTLDRLMRRDPAPVEWAIEVLSFPLPMRDDLLVRLGAFRHLRQDEAERMVNSCPFVLAEHLTFGQAEEIRILMDRERIPIRLVKRDAGASPLTAG